MSNRKRNPKTSQDVRKQRKQKSPYLFCDFCGYYPMIPVHGHYKCPECRQRTSCCEGAPCPK